MTRPLDKRTTTNLLFPDWFRVLNRAEAVETVPERECFLCGARESELVRMRSMDEFRCASDRGCGRRLVKRG